MGKVTEFIEKIKKEPREDKFAIVEYLTETMMQGPKRYSDEESLEFIRFAFLEMLETKKEIESLDTYREKEPLINYFHSLSAIPIVVSGNQELLSEEDEALLDSLQEFCLSEDFLRTEVNKCFGTFEPITKRKLEKIIGTVSEISEEYHKAVFFKEIARINPPFEGTDKEEIKPLRDYVLSEIRRLASNDTSASDASEVFEYLFDVSEKVMDDEVAKEITAIFPKMNNCERYYAVASLVKCGYSVPKEDVRTLAKDIVYAELTYETLAQNGMSDLYPSEYTGEEYLAKSNLVHWLTYPTELGREPDEIEFLGKVKKKKEIYCIFRFKSDSNTLDEEHKNVWLIGWANRDGGTFSEFDFYSDYEKRTVEKTVKYIGKKLI